MKRIVGDQSEQVAEWVCGNVPGMDLGDSPYTAIGLIDPRGYLCAGTVYSNFTGVDVHMHHAQLNQRSLTAHYLGEVFRYPFNKLQVRRCTAIVAASNEASLGFVKHIGFVEEGRIRQYFANGDDAFIFGMLRTECRWLSLRRHHGKPSQSQPQPDAGLDPGAVGSEHGLPGGQHASLWRRGIPSANGRSGTSTLPLGLIADGDAETARRRSGPGPR